MLYYLFEFLENQYQFPGAGLFQYLSFRASVSVILSLGISIIYGKKIIQYLRKNQIGENIRSLGLKGEDKKKGTPTMGGLIIIISTLIPVILMSRLDNIYIQILIFTTIWMCIIGLADDYIKVFRKNKKGLKAKFKLFGQYILGIIVGLIILFHPEITISDSVSERIQIEVNQEAKVLKEVKSFKTTVPFFKDNELDYQEISNSIFNGNTGLIWIIFIPIIILIISSVSNSNNLTDGLDGLSSGLSAIIVFTLGIFAWTSGNIVFSDYLNIMYIPRVGEITIFISALFGALVGFLWYNTYPASIFMGDTGSLTVITQVTYFKMTKKKTGIGKRIFLMSPIHHHFQKKGFHESKIVSRFWIIGIFLALLTILTLKIR